jgi:hypothetical protein
MIHDILNALPIPPGTSPRDIAVLQQAAVTKALDYRPRSPREATLATHIVMSDRASAECYRRAALPDLPHAIVQSYHTKAASLARLSAAQEAALRSLQRLPAPPVLRAGSAAALIAALFCKPPAQPAATAPQDLMPGGAPAPRPAADANAAIDSMHREASVPRPAADADAAKHRMPSGTAEPRSAAGIDARKSPMQRAAPAPVPAAIANGTKPPNGVPAPRPRSAIELPPTPEELYSARLAEDVMRMGREAALARGA